LKNFNFLALFLFVGIVLSSCSKEEDNAVIPAPAPNAPAVGKATIKLDHMWGNTATARLGTPYVTASGDSITLTTFNYYFSNVKLIKSNDSLWSMPDSYYLVRLTSTGSEVELEIPNVPVGEYKGISYMIGVDSTRVVEADLSLPSLQPSNGMFWSWNSGFIFVKCEGTSPQSSRPNRDFIFHIGGYRHPNNAIQTVSHDFGTSRLRVQQNANPELHMKIYVNRFFSGPGREIAMSSFPFNMAVGTNAINISLNYREMFTYDHMHN
jgi:hypothetical protein